MPRSGKKILLAVSTATLCGAVWAQTPTGAVQVAQVTSGGQPVTSGGAPVGAAGASPAAAAKPAPGGAAAGAAMKEEDEDRGLGAFVIPGLAIAAAALAAAAARGGQTSAAQHAIATRPPQ